MEKIIVVATHPDDETLGCGGTILKHKEIGDEVYWLIITGMREGQGFRRSEISARKKEIEAADKLYRFNDVFQAGLATTRLDQYPISEIIGRVSKVFNKVKPSVIYMPFYGDAHSDHRIVFDATHSCTKMFRYPFIKRVLMMETISETDSCQGMKDLVFIPNYFVDITGFLDKKTRIAKIFGSEMGKHPFPRSEENIKALATLRGSQCGCACAESFMMLKELW